MHYSHIPFSVQVASFAFALKLIELNGLQLVIEIVYVCLIAHMFVFTLLMRESNIDKKCSI